MLVFIQFMIENNEMSSAFSHALISLWMIGVASIIVYVRTLRPDLRIKEEDEEREKRRHEALRP